MSKRFIFSVQTKHVLTIDEIWPDGDAPDDPTAEDAAEAFLDSCHGNIPDGLIDWNIAPDRHDLIVTELEEGETFNGE